MKNKHRKAAITIGIILLTLAIFAASFVLFWGGLIDSKKEGFSSHYIVYQGTESRIYLVSEASSYDFANQTYFSADGHKVAEGTCIFIINLTLRNDYSNEYPPPSKGAPVAPIDGTAYICLRASLFNNDVTVGALNVTPSDFSAPSPDETGLVLASGQTNTVQLYLATNETKISGFNVNLDFVGDSIPR